MPLPVGLNGPLRRIALPDEHLKLIALIALEWSRLETIMEEAIWTLTELGSGVGGWHRSTIVGRAVTTHMSYRSRVEVINSLLAEILGQSHSMINEFHQLCVRIDDMRVDRNLLIHGEWILAEPPYLVDHKARKVISATVRLPDLTNMNALRDNIEKAANELNDFAGRLLYPASQFYRRSSYTGPPSDSPG
jgi:hypothetical protein